MLERIGFVNKVKVWDWVKNLESELYFEEWNGKVNCSKRKCLWFGVGVNLGYNCSFFEGKKIDKNLRKRNNELWGGDDWNSILVYKYEKGCELKLHWDRSCFDEKVVLINVSVDDIFGNGSVEFVYGKDKNILKNGEIIRFNNRILHGVGKIRDSERWSISIRKVLF